METQIDLTRWIFSNKSTIGVFSINNEFVCNAIEDVDRNLSQGMTVAEILKRKMYGVTCIPYGRYQIKILRSPRWSIKKGVDVSVPYLMDVPGYSGIEIHPANFASEIKGCIAPGMYDPSRPESVWFSKQSYEKLLFRIAEMLKNSNVYINIVKSSKPIIR